MSPAVPPTDLRVPARWRRGAVLLYGSACAASVVLGLVYGLGFVGNLVVPKSLDSASPLTLHAPLAINLGLIGACFGLYWLCARSRFRGWLEARLPTTARATRALVIATGLGALFAFWQPMNGVVWHLHAPPLAALVEALYAVGAALVIVHVVLSERAEWFGLRRCWRYFRGRPPAPCREIGCRQVLFGGWLLALWATPTMSAGHLVFSLAASLGLLWLIEERE
jgi:methanethiol S-methyltransferase